MKTRIAIVGAGGYGGAELAEIFLHHNHTEIVGLFGSAKREKDGKVQSMDAVHPRFRDRLSLPVAPFELDACLALKPDAVFLATPNEVSLELAPPLRVAGIKVFDLSGAFRLKDASLYPRYYGFEHTAKDLLAAAVYGQPETNRAAIKNADMVAVPGCYPTSAILAIAPLAHAGAIRPGTRVIIDSISGVSGAGRSASLKSLFCEVSLQAYGVLTHRHNPEIDAYSGARTLFTPHLGPFDRGILSTIHVEVAPDFDEARIRELFIAAYRDEPFVRALKGAWPAIADVRGTNFCDIGLAFDPEFSHVILSSAIDNLVKGAAGQAVQCFNIRFGFPEASGMTAKGRHAP